MARLTIREYISNMDFFGAKETEKYKEGQDPTTHLLAFESMLLKEKLTLKELKDGFAAFREKVCIPKFIGKLSPPCMLAQGTLSLLIKCIRELDENNSLTHEIGHELVDTWLSLLRTGPSSGHIVLMSELSSYQLYGKYLKSCSAQEINMIFSQMKIKFRYDDKKETDENNFVSELYNEQRFMFECMNRDNFQHVKSALLDLYMHYQRQHLEYSGLMEMYTGDLLGNLSSICPKKNPFTGIKDVTVLKQHLAFVKEFICTFDGDLERSHIDETLRKILKVTFEGNVIKDIFSDLMNIMSDFSKRKISAQNAHIIYTKCRGCLFNKLKKANVVVDGAMFESCIKMMVTVLENVLKPDSESESHFMVYIGMEECIWTFTTMSLEQVKMLFALLVVFLKSGTIRLVKQAQETICRKEYMKVFVWKDLIEEIKKFFAVTGLMSCDKMEVDTGRETYSDVIHEYREFLIALLEILKRHKLLPLIQKELVMCIFSCLETSPLLKDQIAEALSYDCRQFLSTIKDAALNEEILDRCNRLLKNADTKWTYFSSITVSTFLNAVVESYNGNGKAVPKNHNSAFMSIFASACQGDNITEQFFPVDDDQFSNGNVQYLVYSSVGSSYLRLHKKSSTLDCCITYIRDIVKWAKISQRENNEQFLEVTCRLLDTVGMDAPSNMADLLPDIVNLFFQLQDAFTIHTVVTTLYPLKPDCVHKRFNDFLDKLKAANRQTWDAPLSVIEAVSRKHPEVFTNAQVGMLIDLLCAADFANSSIQFAYLNIIQNITNHAPQKAQQHFSKFMNDIKFSKDTLVTRAMILVAVSVNNTKHRKAAIDYLMKFVSVREPTIVLTVIGQLIVLAKDEKDYMQKHKPAVQKVKNTTNSPDIKHACHDLINVMEGKSIDVVFEKMQQQQESVVELDQKVGATMTTMVSIGDHVIQQHHEISKVTKNMEKLEEKVNDVEEDLGETKVKVEEIDGKTMTNAPKWSRDVTKLMNPMAKNDWRLLASRLGYKNDDIRGWAQQHDPCMALLSEWYTTHKTSEATFGLLTALQEMNRTDTVVIVENAMKTAEGVVEDEEFEYPTPPEIFLSYQWGMQNEVKLLKQHLNMAGYECWMDIGQMGGGDKLFAKIDSGIRAAKVVICCATEKYSQSPNCNREVNLSVSLGKPIIPLLMVNMPWPPKGSMGPIFSEYLFIRFFQRAGEETMDQRFWPVSKFQELLMQLNYYVSPKQSLVKPEYSKWWVFIMEDIKIDKKADTNNSKSFHSAKGPGTNDVSPVVFLSYQWGKQPQIKALYQRLTSLGYTVWMDIFQMGGGDSLYDKIDRGIRGCKVVVSCVTPKYALSANCRREISLADALKKPIVPLLLEQMKWPPDGPMSMVFTELLYINVHKDVEVQNKWMGEKFDELVNKLRQHIQEVTPSRDVKVTGSSQTNRQKSEKVSMMTTKKDRINMSKTDGKSENSNVKLIDKQSNNTTGIHGNPAVTRNDASKTSKSCTLH